MLALQLVTCTWWEGLKQAQDQIVPLLVRGTHLLEILCHCPLPSPPPPPKWPGSSGNLSDLRQALLPSSAHLPELPSNLNRLGADLPYLPGPWLTLGWCCCILVSPYWWQVAHGVVCGRKREHNQKAFPRLPGHLWALAPCTLPPWTALLHQTRTQPMSVSPGFLTCLLLLFQIHQLSLFSQLCTELGFRKRG